MDNRNSIAPASHQMMRHQAGQDTSDMAAYDSGELPLAERYGTCGPDNTAAGSPTTAVSYSPAVHRWPFMSTLPLGSLPGAVPCARLHTRNILKEWDLAEVTDDAELIVSELVTNALRASWAVDGTPPFTLSLQASRERLVIQVWDALSAMPDPRPHAIDAETGRGLEIVGMISHHWGFYQHPEFGGKVVWAVIEIRRSNYARRDHYPAGPA
jgi:anti-sigma regulatory factor (Ser/Thr protein kinase)